MRFDEFMNRALYHPVEGYYRRKDHDPFGKDGDFYTASQLQPLFGQIIASEARLLAPGEPIFELGPGRREMAPYLGPRYTGVDVGDALPSVLDGFVFANEFFDALPVRAGWKEGGNFYELFVEDPRYSPDHALDEDARRYVERYWPFVPEGGSFEIGLEALGWIDRLAERMRRGFVLVIDYGYTTAETMRFPQGALMSYHRQVASEEIFKNPGSRDITAHVAFDALRDRALHQGFLVIGFETLASFVLRVIEREPAFTESPEAKKQLKTLLFGMGEAFQCLLLRKEGL